MLGLTPIREPEIVVEPTPAEVEAFQETMKQGVTFALLMKDFRTHAFPIHGTCVVVPEHRFKPDWKNTLETQGCKVIYCPDMVGGGCYLIRNNELQKVKEMAKQHLPRDESRTPY
jgi:hypothetical protein